MAVNVVDFQNNGISRRIGGNDTEADYDATSLPLAAGDIVFYGTATQIGGGGANWFADFGAGVVNLVNGPFTVDGGASSTIDTNLVGDGHYISIKMHTVVAEDLISGSDPLARFGWRGNAASSDFYGGGFMAVVVRGEVYESMLGSWTSNTAQDTAPSNPSTKTLSGSGNPGERQLMLAFAAIQDGGTTGDNISSTDGVVMTAIEATAQWNNGSGSNSFCDRALYGVDGDDSTNADVTFTGDNDGFGSGIITPDACITGCIVGFESAADTGTDAWGWVG